MYDEKFEEPAELAAVFGFSKTKLDGSTKYICTLLIVLLSSQITPHIIDDDFEVDFVILTQFKCTKRSTKSGRSFQKL